MAQPTDPAGSESRPVPTGAIAILTRLQHAIDAHDLDALVDCFAEDYVNETPVHPQRGFHGREQVRRNWEQIFGAIPDINAHVVRATADGDTVWSEWEHRGTRPDGAGHLMRGIVIFGVVDGRAAWARFYLEPVDDAPGDVNAAVRDHVGAEAAS